MNKYSYKIIKLNNSKFLAAIMYNYEVVATKELYTEQDAVIWVDDEICRISTGKGLWE